MPGFGHDFGDPHDLGVLLLPKDSVPGSITPVRLAPAGYLDSLKAQGTLKFLNVDAVGYGAIPDWDSPGPTTFSYRREASIRHARRHRADQVVPALQPEPERDRERLRAVLR